MVEIRIPLFMRKRARVRKSVGTYSTMAVKPISIIGVPYMALFFFALYLDQILIAQGVRIPPYIVASIQMAVYTFGLSGIFMFFVFLRFNVGQDCARTENFSERDRWDEHDWSEVHVGLEEEPILIAEGPEINLESVRGKVKDVLEEQKKREKAELEALEKM